MLPAVRDFVSAFAMTLAVVGVTIVLGRSGRRRAHLAAAAVSTVLLGVTIYRAELLGRALVIPRGILAVHLVFANLGALAFLLVVATGTRLFRAERQERRVWHRRAVVAFLALVVLATATGTWMIRASEPRPAADVAAPVVEAVSPARSVPRRAAARPRRGREGSSRRGA